MRKLILFLSLLISVNTLLTAQDLIRTKKGDDMNVKITKIEPENIFFKTKVKGRRIETYLDRSKIEKYEIDYFNSYDISNQSNIGLNYNPKFHTGNIPNRNEKIQISINVGKTFLFGIDDENGDETINKINSELISGINYDLHLDYLISGDFGLSSSFGKISSSGSGNVIFEDDLGNNISFNVEDDIIETYFMIGGFMNFTSNNFFFQPSINLGGIMFKENLTIKRANYSTNTKGSTFGFLARLKIGYLISDKLYITANVSLVSGTLNEIEVDGENHSLSGDNTIGIGGASLSGGLAYKL